MQSKKLFNLGIVLIIVSIGLIALPLLAQDMTEPPDILKIFVSPDILAAAAAIVVATQYIKNVFKKAKGWVAVGIAGLASLVYSGVQYNEKGIVYVIVVAVVAFLWTTLTFKGSTALGNKLNGG